MTLRGSTSEFPLEAVIGLLAGTSKTGELQVRTAVKVGALGFASGHLVAAVMDGEGGDSALGAIFAIGDADFEFTPWASAPEANLEPGDLATLLKRAADARERLAQIRQSIPDDRMRFRLSERAADSGAVTFTPDRWRVLLAVNGERDVMAIADQLRLGKMQTLNLLAGLVKDGVIDATPPPEAAPTPTRESTSAAAPAAPFAEPVSTKAEEGAPPKPSSEPAPTATAPEHPAPPSRDWKIPSTEHAGPVAERHHADLQAELAERMAEPTPAHEPSAAPPGPEVPRAVDDRLSSLTGLFAPGPAANVEQAAAAEAEAKQQAEPRTPPQPAPARPAESWLTPPPAASEAPANTWAPSAKPEPAPAADPWATATPPSAGPARMTAAPLDEPLQARMPAAPAEAFGERKKSGGFFGRFFKEEATPPPLARIGAAPAVGSTIGMLASLSNAMLMEFGSGNYGKGKIETRLANLLMRVDEQADPIDRPLPVVDDLIDAAALEREGFAEDQAVPYLSTLVRQIYEDAERAFGKDKAKRGYKAAQQQVLGADVNVLQSPALAGRLPKA